MKTFKSRAVVGVSLVALMAIAGQAQAATGTAAGTNVNNTATVNYTVGGVSQNPVSSNTATFVVDRKVNLTVAEVGGAATSVQYNQANQVTTFTVTNTTNSTQDFRLIGSNLTIGLTTALGKTDSFGMSNIRVFVDSNNNGVYDAGVDTATYIDELAPDATKTVFIVADAPASGPAGGAAGVNLTAVAAAGGTGGSLGSDLTASVTDDPTQVDTVFADGAGWVDLARDGRYSAGDEYDIGAPTASATKTATVISDPLNGVVLPKAIPGAVVEYCIQVQNIGVSSLTGVAITDSIPTNTTYVANSTYTGGTVLAGVCVANGTSAADGTVFDGSKISATIGSIGVASTSTVRFRVTLN